MGRTQMQDAVPMTLGQEFATFSRMTMEDIQRLKETVPLLREINLGGTCGGTGERASGLCAKGVWNSLKAFRL